MENKTEPQTQSTVQHARAIIDILNAQAQNSHDATEALKFSQAALNVANSYLHPSSLFC